MATQPDSTPLSIRDHLAHLRGSLAELIDRARTQEDLVLVASTLSDLHVHLDARLAGDLQTQVPAVDRTKKATTSGQPVEEVLAAQRADPSSGMHEAYVVLSDEERAKGFVRPVRRTYRHLHCQTITTMGISIAETYARDPSFYGSTFCVQCNGHFPVGSSGQFVWDGTSLKVGT